MIRDTLNSELKSAMKSGQKRRVDTIRLVNAAIKDRDIEARGQGKSLEDPDLLAILQKMIKTRQESIDLYNKAGRLDLVERETEEVTVIKEFMPQQMSDADVLAAVETAIGQVGASSIKDMGKVVGSLKEQYAGRMDFARASALIKARLSA